MSTFKHFFLGSAKYINKVKILNPEVLQFSYNKDKSILTAKAVKPIIIENKYLSYKIVYNLDTFQVKYENHEMIMNLRTVKSYQLAGTTFFKELSKPRNRFSRRRKEVYFLF